MNNIDERCRAYETVAQAIRFIRSNSSRQPGLEEIAAQVGMSPFHLQRTFSIWAGISPKRFLQYLTRAHARALLRQSHDVLAASHEAGLSGPGRLHDLMVTCDAVTPGEIRALGAGLEINYGFGLTPFGRIIAGITPRGLCHLQFSESGDVGAASAIRALRDTWPQARLTRNDKVVNPITSRLLCLHNERPTRQQPLHLLLHGSNFQIKVWEALLRIPSGSIVSYGTLAGMAGCPRAPRAVGSALAQNRVALLIPCHRVIRENGETGQYRWTAERKQALLAFESAAVHS